MENESETAGLCVVCRKPVRVGFRMHQSCLDRERGESVVLGSLSGQGSLSVDKARAQKVCRICRQPMSPPFVTKHGSEHAHQDCLGREGTATPTVVQVPASLVAEVAVKLDWASGYLCALDGIDCQVGVALQRLAERLRQRIDSSG